MGVFGEPKREWTVGVAFAGSREEAASLRLAGQPRRLSLDEHLEVLEPPVTPLSLKRGEPAAGEIEQDDRNRPDQIKKGKAPHVALWRLGIAHGMVGEEPGADVPEANFRDDKGERMDQGDVKHVIEEGHASEKSDSAGDGAVQSLDQRDQRDDGAERHQQEVERRGIFRRVQK